MARYAERVRSGGNPPSRSPSSANMLLEQIAIKDLLISERERSLVGLLSGLHEARRGPSRRHRFRESTIRRC